MDPVIRKLFGNMPISQLNDVQLANAKSQQQNTVLFLGLGIVVLGVTIYSLYKQNVVLKARIVKR
jgi:hypothetical protein